MRWPWSRRKRDADTEAVQRAQDRLDDVRSKQDEVDRLANRLRDIRDSNHFADLLAGAFRDRRR